MGCLKKDVLVCVCLFLSMYIHTYIHLLLQRYHGQEKLEANNLRYKMTQSLEQQIYHVMSLEICDVVPKDQGDYRVCAVNEFGESVATLHLNFEGNTTK